MGLDDWTALHNPGVFQEPFPTRDVWIAVRVSPDFSWVIETRRIWAGHSEFHYVATLVAASCLFTEKCISRSYEDIQDWYISIGDRYRLGNL